MLRMKRGRRMETKRCSKCGILKPVGEFYRNYRLRGGVQGSCKECARGIIRRTGLPNKDNRDRGAAGEHFVIHWLLARRFEVGGPHNPNGKHDLFVKLGRWYTVQVKVGKVNLRTGGIYLNRRSVIASDLIAIVDLEGGRLRWVSNTDEPLPEELLT
jgi:hypothetical protein